MFAIYYLINSNKEVCYIEAQTIEEALGKFFMGHKDITYNEILDHMEV